MGFYKPLTMVFMQPRPANFGFCTGLPKFINVEEMRLFYGLPMKSDGDEQRCLRLFKAPPPPSPVWPFHTGDAIGVCQEDA